MDFETCCQILGLTATDLGIHPKKINNLNLDQLTKLPDLIKSRYKRLSLKHHPDKGGNPDNWDKLVKAYEAATKTIEDLIKVKQQNSQEKHATPVTQQQDWNSWFQNFFNDTTQQQPRPPRQQNHPGDPRNWYYSYDDDSSAQETNETYYQYANEQAEREDWFSFLNEKIFNSYRSAQNDIEKFHDKITALNKKLEEEYQAEEQKIYQQAFNRYQQKKSSYYNEFKKAQYQQYITQFSHTKEVNKNKVIQNYQPFITRSNVWINLGFAFCFLGFPLLLSFFQWQNKKKLETERDLLLQTAEQANPLGMAEWIQGQGISITTWEQQHGFRDINAFKNKFSATLEGIEAVNATSILRAKLINKKLHNQRIDEEVKGMQISVKDGEAMLEQHLFAEDKPRHFNNDRTERRNYGFRM